MRILYNDSKPIQKCVSFFVFQKNPKFQYPKRYTERHDFKKKEGKTLQRRHTRKTRVVFKIDMEEEDKDKEEKRPLRTKDDALNPENVKAEKLRSKDVLDDVLNAVRFCVRFLNKRSTFEEEGENKDFWMHI